MSTRGRLRSRLKQKGAAAIRLTARQRRALDLLDEPESDVLEPGDSTRDLAGPDATDDWIELAEDDADPPSDDPQIAGLFNGRMPAVLVRASMRGQTVVVEPDPALSRPGGSRAAKAVQLVSRMLQFALDGARQTLPAEDFQRLLGLRDATSIERYLLILRVAISADTKIQGEEPFSPSDHAIDRYRSKFATLPDGLAVSVRLFLRDDRGGGGRGRNGSSSPLARLPAGLLLMALRNILDAELRDQRILSDAELGSEIRRLHAQWGVRLPSNPTDEDVRNLRGRLKRLQLGNLFPNAPERRRALRGQSAEGGENVAR